MAYQMLEMANQPLDFQILQTENTQEKLEKAGSQPNQNFFLGNNDRSKKRLKPKRQKLPILLRRLKQETF